MKKYIVFLLIAVTSFMYAQQTYIPDDNFEQTLIILGLDSPPLNDSVPTKNIDTVTNLVITNMKISSLLGIEDFKSLEILRCEDNLLTEIDISKNTSLQILDCAYTQITKINISKNILLKELYLASNQLANLDVSKNIALIKLDFSYNIVSNIDVSQNTKLQNLNCQLNQLPSLDVSNNPELKYLFCYYNKIQQLDVSKNTSLSILTCSGNNLSSLNIKNGNNKEMGLYDGIVFDASNNPNLFCIQVDDSTFSANSKRWKKDSQTHYSSDCGSTGIEYINEEFKSISISPNPSSDIIEITKPSEGWEPSEGFSNAIRIFNVFGVIVSTSVCSADTSASGGQRIDVSGLPSGVYFVRVGEKVGKFVKI